LCPIFYVFLKFSQISRISIEKRKSENGETSEQRLGRFWIKASACWPGPTTMEAARAASAYAHDTLGTVVTACWVAMVARLPTSTLASRPGEISGQRTGVKRRSHRAAS
jgi:hypothetical protein